MHRCKVNCFDIFQYKCNFDVFPGYSPIIIFYNATALNCFQKALTFAVLLTPVSLSVQHFPLVSLRFDNAIRVKFPPFSLSPSFVKSRVISLHYLRHRANTCARNEAIAKFLTEERGIDTFTPSRSHERGTEERNFMKNVSTTELICGAERYVAYVKFFRVQG